ncbi:MAG: ribosome recycling factor [Candidatus Latescibacterota bacterium]
MMNIKAEAKSKMEKTLAAVRHEMTTIRTGTASTALLDGIRVEYYGSLLPLNQVANIAAPEPKLLTIQPWDKKVVPIIERAIMSSDLGLTPANDGHTIRLPIPQLTGERRKELVHVVRKMVEEARVAIRNIRRDANEHLKKEEKQGELSEDERRRAQDEMQELTNAFIKQIDGVLEHKETEIMEV